MPHEEDEGSCDPEGTRKGPAIPSAPLLLWVPTTASGVYQGKAGGGRGTAKNPKHRLVVCPAWAARVEMSFLCPFSSPHLLIVRRAPPLSSPSQSTAAAAKSLQSCPTLCDPIDGSPPGSSIPGILQQEHWSGLPFPSPKHESEK